MHQITEKTISPSKLIAIFGILSLLILGVRLILAPVQEVQAGVDIAAWLRFTQISEHIHALSACIFLALSVGAIITRKGSENHKIYGKLGFLTLLLGLLSAAALLIYLTIEDPSGGIYTSRVMIYENNSILFTLLISGSYGGITGYRWAALPQPKLDLDLVSGGCAILGSIFSIALIPFVVILDPITAGNVGFPLTPFTAGLLLAGQGALLGYFGYDDISGFYGKKAGKTERVIKHTYRIMIAVGAAFTAIGIVHLGPVFINYPNLVWLLYFVPPSIIVALTISLKINYITSTNRKA